MRALTLVSTHYLTEEEEDECLVTRVLCLVWHSVQPWREKPAKLPRLYDYFKSFNEFINGVVYFLFGVSCFAPLHLTHTPLIQIK